MTLMKLIGKGLTISAVALWASTAIAADFTMKISTGDTDPVEGEQHLSSTPLKAFADEVEKASNGRIDVKIFWGGQLGKVENVLNLVRGGQVEAQVAADGHVAPYFPDIEILGLPYIFVNRKVAYEVLDGPAGQMMADRMAEKAGFRPMPWMENGGYRNFSANRPLATVEDMAGLKIRTMSNPVHMEIVKSLGASPTPVPWADLYTSLQTGVVDGQENSLSTFRVPKLEEVQKNIILDGHVYSVMGLFVSQKWLDTLPDDLKAVLATAAEHMKAMNRRLSIENEKTDRAYLESVGVNIVDPSTEEKARFRAKTQGPALKLLKDTVDADMLETFLDAAKAAESKL